MDLIVKIALAIFGISVMLIFFKVTKKMGENYLEDKMVPQKTFDYEHILDEIENQDSVPIEEFNWQVPDYI